MQPPQYPYAPPPPPEYHPVQPKPTRWQRFRALGCCKQSLIGCLTLFVLGCGILCMLAIPPFMQGVQHGIATQTAQSRATTIALTPTQAALITHGQPRMGGALSDFVGKFGQPTKIAQDSETFASKQVQITATINGTATVDRIYLTGPSTWNVNDDYSFCLQFLPSDAVEFQRNVGPINWIDYHSSLGEIVMQLQNPTCLLFISPSP